MSLLLPGQLCVLRNTNSAVLFCLTSVLHFACYGHFDRHVVTARLWLQGIKELLNLGWNAKLSVFKCVCLVLYESSNKEEVLEEMLCSLVGGHNTLDQPGVRNTHEY